MATPKVGDKVTFHYGRIGEVKPYPATVVDAWPEETTTLNGKPLTLPQALVLDVTLPDEILAAGINPRQSHSTQTAIPDPALVAKWTALSEDDRAAIARPEPVSGSWTPIG